MGRCEASSRALRGGAWTPRRSKTFGETLSQHIRTEERQLFEECQRQMPAGEIAHAGAALEEYFVNSGMPGASCALASSSKQKKQK